MKRAKWKFNYSVQDLLPAAQKKLAFYEGRLEFWKKSKEEVIAKIKAEGLSFDESVAEGYSNSGRSTSIQVDDGLRRDLSECNSKINEHTENVAIYDGWVEVLAAAKPTDQYPLNQDDWLFFFSDKVTSRTQQRLGLKGF